MATVLGDNLAQSGLSVIASTEASGVAQFAGSRRVRRADEQAGRLLDIVVALVALTFFAPLMVLIIMLVRSTSSGPVLFRQPRLGKDGRVFTCYKFRTMHVDADQRLGELLAKCDHSSMEWSRDQKLRADPRILPTGRVLRRLSLDELPQLLNVLQGDMSIVGPRPIVPGEVWRYGRHIRAYQTVRPGITGLWQINGRNHTTYRRRVACDVLYARTKSVVGDVKILVKTVPVLLTAHGAY